MSMNGIGPMVSAWVHARNAAKHVTHAAKGGVSPEPVTPVEPAPSGAAPAVDTVEFSAEAMARFEAWKTKHGGASSDAGVTVATPDAQQTCPAPSSPELA